MNRRVPFSRSLLSNKMHVNIAYSLLNRSKKIYIMNLILDENFLKCYEPISSYLHRGHVFFMEPNLLLGFFIEFLHFLPWQPFYVANYEN